jgi:hypothetical protein
VLQSPTKPFKDCARETHCSPSHVSRIFNSPDFQRHYQAARKIIGEEISRAALPIAPKRNRSMAYVRFHADCVCFALRSRHAGTAAIESERDPTRTFKLVYLNWWIPEFRGFHTSSEYRFPKAPVREFRQPSG